MVSAGSRRFEVKEIGTVKNDYHSEVPEGYKDDISEIEVYERYENGLLGIEKNSHIGVICWFDRSEREVKTVHPMGNESNPLTGVFATRAPVRPNPISHTVCELLRREENTLHVKGLDALNDTPVIDIKAHKRYSVEDPKFPDWAPEG